MAFDPLDRAAMQRAVELSADIEVQFTDKTGKNPVMALLGLAQKRAAEAIVAIASVDPENPKVIRGFQNEITCFALIVSWLREIVKDGFEASSLLDEQDRADLADAIGLTEDEAEQLLASGFSPHED